MQFYAIFAIFWPYNKLGDAIAISKSDTINYWRNPGGVGGVMETNPNKIKY